MYIRFLYSCVVLSQAASAALLLAPLLSQAFVANADDAPAAVKVPGTSIETHLHSLLLNFNLDKK